MELINLKDFTNFGKTYPLVNLDVIDYKQIWDQIVCLGLFSNFF